MLWIVVCVVAVLAGTVALKRACGRRPFSLKGCHVLVTGGSSGIGKAVALEAVRRGASVTLLARNEEKLQSAKQEVEAAIGSESQDKQGVCCVSVDVSGSDEEVAGAIEKAVKQLGPVGVLVNSAGVTFPAAFLDTPTLKFQELYQTNVLGSVRVTRAVLPQMIRERRGRVVFISSQAGQCAVYGYSAYSASKFALRGLAECLQMEVKPFNVLVCVSFPPDTDTPQLQEELETRSAITNAITGSSGVMKPEQVAEDVVNGVQSGQFTITHGFDGALLGAVTSGFSPVHSLMEGLLQVLLMSAVRLLSFFYIASFNKIVHKHLKATPAGTTAHPH